jgi:hypothetical protein
MVHHYDHRWATYEPDGVTSRDMTAADKQNPTAQALPRYWVREREVIERTARVPQLLRKALKLKHPVALPQITAFWLAGSLFERAEDWTEGGFGPPNPGLADDLLAKLRAVEDDSIFEEGFDLLGTEERDLAYLCEDWRPPSPADDLSDQAGQLAQAIMWERTPRALLGWRDDICRTTDTRTTIASVIPLAAVGDKFLLMYPVESSDKRAALQGNLISLPFDYIARQKVAGVSLKYFTMKQLPVLPPDAYTQADLDNIVPRVLELTYTARDLEPFAEDLSYEGPPFPFDPDAATASSASWTPTTPDSTASHVTSCATSSIPPTP